MNRAPGLLADRYAQLLIAFARKARASRARMLDSCPGCGATFDPEHGHGVQVFGLYLEVDTGASTAYVLCEVCADMLLEDAARVTAAVEACVAGELADLGALQA